ncbi:hypothetical protein Tco_1246148 [Tanacetum coccineum]
MKVMMIQMKEEGLLKYSNTLLLQYLVMMKTISSGSYSNMRPSQEAVAREKEKGVELFRKDKGVKKRKIEEKDESESQSDGIPEAEKKFKQLASDEEMARKVQEEWEGEEERKRLAKEEATNDALIRNYDDIKARIEADRLLAEMFQERRK